MALQMADKLWLSMATLFGSKWASQNGEKPDMTWRALLKNAEPRDLTLIRNRLLQESELWIWPPTLIQFQTLLREARIERIGLPLAVLAFTQAKRRDWSGAATYETAHRVGLGDLLGSAYIAVKPDKEMLVKWKEVYSQVCAEIMQGKEFSGPPNTEAPALPKSLPVTDEDRARARPGIDALRKRLGCKPWTG